MEQKLAFILFHLAIAILIQGQRQQRSTQQTGGESGKSESASAAAKSPESREGGRATLKHTASHWQDAHCTVKNVQPIAT